MPDNSVLGGVLGSAVGRRLAAADTSTDSIRILTADTAEAGRIMADAARAMGMPWLPVVAELDRVVIGPVVRPGTAGCDLCSAERRAGARSDHAESRALSERYGTAFSAHVSPLLTPLAADLAATLAEALCGRASVSGAGLRTVTVLRLADLRVTHHRFLPDPHCPHCGQMPDDGPELAAIPRQVRLKPSPAGTRVRDLLSEAAALETLYVDDETGIVKDLRARGLHTLPFVESKVGPRESVDGGYGRAFDFRTARVTAVAEALERLGGGRPGGRRTVVSGSYHELSATHSGAVLDPSTVGMHEPARYQEPGFPYQAYHPDLSMPWVWGYSLTDERPILVPESLAYYRTQRHASGPRPFVSEISNGCALGGCIEEAALYGLLELAERDAFLRTWYTRTPAPPIDLSTARDRRIPLLADQIRVRQGYDVEVFDITGEEGVPCFWALARDRVHRPDRPAVLCAAGSGLDPERGVLSALYELVTAVEAYLMLYPERRDEAERMRLDSEAVRLMDDHALLYCDAVAAERLDFLRGAGNPDSPTPPLTPPPTPTPTPLDLTELTERYAWPPDPDLRADLDALVGRYAASGLEVIVVDQTTPVHAAARLACAKVLAPGLLPMTFGHHLRRIEGLDRAVTAGEVNPWPHPFP
ncbi:TOMM precursor leader peptide-binding protein [Catenulispora pinisilvae]|uniref:TOMM precursor leader peptide-binding protein n=1 Tax=Catenulispora pinisilvae TaxID=2705253 RepID=UPI0018921B03|nr:TOMM precursor leader peptide-binding protein [Catenulispora pinisilvae]